MYLQRHVCFHEAMEVHEEITQLRHDLRANLCLKGKGGSGGTEDIYHNSQREYIEGTHYMYVSRHCKIKQKDL